MPTITMDSKLSAAIGGDSAKKLRDAFGFETVEDLLHHYPRTYFRSGEPSQIDHLDDGEHVSVSAQVLTAELKRYEDRRTRRTAYRIEAVVSNGEVDLALTFFFKKKHLVEWQMKKLRPGTWGLFSGRVDRFRRQTQLVNPRCELFGDEEDESAHELAERRRRQRGNFHPIYPASAKVESWDIEASVRVVLDLLDGVPEVVPRELLAERDLVSAGLALRWIHQPEDWAQVQAAQKSLRFAEAFTTQVVLARRRWEAGRQPAQPRRGRPGGLLDQFDARLPFRLTDGQRVVGEQIADDLAAGHPMHRLLQGEVGSGKTVVALRAMLQVVDSGGQAALLAPTEVLAQQHHRSITAMLGDLAAGGMLGGAADGTQVALLTGSTGSAARKAALLDSASGAAGIVIGTHALLEEKVQFADLGLVVVDEQHRFGVEQRAALTSKAADTPPHVLVMTATPIPRTVAMTVFGDLETSVLAELPAGRAPVQTNVVSLLANPQWLDRAWERVCEEVAKGHQVYVVCPRIGGDDDTSAEDDGVVVDLAEWREAKAGGRRTGSRPKSGSQPKEESKQKGEDRPPLAAVEEVAPLLADGALRGLRVEMMHGRMPAERKDRVMQAFAAGEVDVLVSTTVIEVGVDVPNATMMVILDAERFGVSQLHQLRGRIGRGGLPGLCLLVTRTRSLDASQRLTSVAATNDGFALSQVDLEQRREGDVLGTLQSGGRSGLKLLSVLRHEDVIVDARAAATALVASDPELTHHRGLAGAVRRLVDSEQAEYLEKA